MPCGKQLLRMCMGTRCPSPHSMLRHRLPPHMSPRALAAQDNHANCGSCSSNAAPGATAVHVACHVACNIVHKSTHAHTTCGCMSPQNMQGPAAVAAAGSCTSLHVVHNTQIDTLCLPKPRTSQPTYFAYVTPGGGAVARTAGSSTHPGTVLDQMHLQCVHLRRHSPAPAPPPPFNLCAHQCNMKEPGCLQHWQR